MVKLSRSKIDLFLECPRCFWLDVKNKIKRPSFPPYTINLAIDHLLKEEFDHFRELQQAHPVMQKFGIDAVPYQSADLSRWRHNFTGVQFHHQPTDFLTFGAVDDVWLNPQGELIVVDYKATGANQHQIYDSYARQMEIYQWLLRQNGFAVSPTGYFLFARANKTNGFGAKRAGKQNSETNGVLPFDLFIEPCAGDDSWLEQTLRNARGVYDLDKSPAPAPECEHCLYQQSAGRF